MLSNSNLKPLLVTMHNTGQDMNRVESEKITMPILKKVKKVLLEKQFNILLGNILYPGQLQEMLGCK